MVHTHTHNSVRLLPASGVGVSVPLLHLDRLRCDLPPYVHPYGRPLRRFDI